MTKKVTINDIAYEVIEDVNEALDKDLLKEKITDYYDEFDYIVGDWAYGKVRLKGFNNHNNKYVKNYNDYNKVDDYILNKCAYGCKYFILEKVNTTVEKGK